MKIFRKIELLMPKIGKSMRDLKFGPEYPKNPKNAVVGARRRPSPVV